MQSSKGFSQQAVTQAAGMAIDVADRRAKDALASKREVLQTQDTPAAGVSMKG